MYVKHTIQHKNPIIIPKHFVTLKNIINSNLNIQKQQIIQMAINSNTHLKKQSKKKINEEKTKYLHILKSISFNT